MLELFSYIAPLSMASIWFSAEMKPGCKEAVRLPKGGTEQEPEISGTNITLQTRATNEEWCFQPCRAVSGPARALIWAREQGPACSLAGAQGLMPNCRKSLHHRPFHTSPDRGGPPEAEKEQ